MEMIVRDSPNARVQSRHSNWPPKSPAEALLASPSGRKKLERRREQQSPSPSPTRRPVSTRKSNAQDRDSTYEEEEDEETLQLQIKALEAKLKLKKLQSSKAKRNATSDTEKQESAIESSRKLQQRLSPPPPQAALEVPHSPIRPAREQKPPISPARVLLGIDKGLRAQDVSLKRASSQLSNVGASRLTGPRDVSRSSSVRSGQHGISEPAAKPLSFSDRIAQTRDQDREREEKQKRVEQTRSRGFGADTAYPTPASSRTTLPTSTRKPAPRTGGGNSSSQSVEDDPFISEAKSTSSAPPKTEDEASASFDPFSGFHLTKRTLDHATLTRKFKDREIYDLPRLLKEIKGPNYDPPDCESDYIVLGVIASKSTPLNHRGQPKTTSTADSDTLRQRTKFMAITLVDLKWSVDLYLFDTGFERFWKLQEGTVIALLNPGIMPPRDRDKGNFGLKMTSSEDTVLEIGIARDLGFCKATKANGQQCSAWIDKRKTEFCEFHISLQVEKAKSSRMEVNTIAGYGGRKSDGSSVGQGRGGGMFGKHGGAGGKDDGLLREGKYHDKYLHETAYLLPKQFSNALREVDKESRELNRAETHRKRLAERERERDMASALGKIGSGGGMGSKYLSIKTKTTTTTEENSSSSNELRTVNATDLGLLGKKAGDVLLSRDTAAGEKRKRLASGTSTSSRSEPIGWGGANKRGLLLSPRKRDPDTGVKEGEHSPSKRARFMIQNKGIREPGRESIGDAVSGAAAKDSDNDDDDDLDIVQ